MCVITLAVYTKKSEKRFVIVFETELFTTKEDCQGYDILGINPGDFISSTYKWEQLFN